MITIEQIRAKLQEAIRTSGLKQSEIARRLGIKHTQISCYLNGSKMPSLETFANICVVLDVEPNDILCFEDYKSE